VAVLFDFDGTLTTPGALDWAALRAAIGCPADSFTLEYIQGLPEGGPREAALTTLERFEIDGAAGSRPAPGAEALVRRLRDAGLPLGIVSRNGRAAIDRALRNFTGLRPGDFGVIITRDDPLPPKPAPDTVLAAAERLGVAPHQVLFVGDFTLDMLAGRAAGAVTVYLEVNDHSALGDDERFARPDEACDHIIERLDKIDAIVGL
jgi:hydrogenase expression/formation protein HypE